MLFRSDPFADATDPGDHPPNALPTLSGLPNGAAWIPWHPYMSNPHSSTVEILFDNGTEPQVPPCSVPIDVVVQQSSTSVAIGLVGPSARTPCAGVGIRRVITVRLQTALGQRSLTPIN